MKTFGNNHQMGMSLMIAVSVHRRAFFSGNGMDFGA